MKLNALFTDPLDAAGHRTGYVDVEEALAFAGVDGLLTAVDGRTYKIVSGVLRNGGASAYFQPIDDGVGGHRPQNVDTVTTSTTAIVINYPTIDVQRVVTFIAVPDETYAQLGVTIGVSVGLSASTISVFRQRNFSDEIHYDGAAWVRSSGSGSEDAGSPFVVASFTSGVLRLTHTTIAGGPSGAGHPYAVSLAAGGITYRPVINGTVNATEVNISFVPAAGGAVVTTPDTNMSVYVTRPAMLPQLVSPQGLTQANSNIWFYGVFEV